MTSDNPLSTATDPSTPLHSTEHDDGSVEYQFPVEDENGNMVDPTEKAPDEPDGTDHYDNLVHYLEDDQLMKIANEVVDGYDEDENSRAGHIDTVVDAINNLGISDKQAITPFDGACTVYHPLLIENAVKLQAKASAELLPANGPVKTQILGDAQPAQEEQADRIRAHMNWQLTKQMPEYYSNSEKAFFHACLLGDAFKAKSYDPIYKRVRDRIITLDRLVVNHGCENIEAAERITEVMHMSEVQMKQHQYSGLFSTDIDVGSPYRIQQTELQDKINDLLGLNSDNAEGYEVLSQHRFLDLPGFEDPSGIPLPYIVYVEKQTNKVLGIYRNWCEDADSKFVKREWYSHYSFVPAFGFYSLGYIHLLGNFQRTLTAILRSLVDAGQFANLQGGFKAKTMRILDNDFGPLSPGEFRDVENFGGDLRNSIVPLPFKEPSQALFELLQFIEARGQKFADSTEQVLADSTNYGPVGTTMALLDASTKFFSAIHKRFHKAQGREFEIIAYLNRENLPVDGSKISYNIPNATITISKQDYNELIDISPVSDPNISSNAHRMQLASTKLQAAEKAPQLHNMREIYSEFYYAMGVENVEKILPLPQQAQPMDPVSDIQAAARGQPIMAFPNQDHDAHIAVKTAFLESPQLGGNDLMKGPTMSAIQANIRDHLVMKFANQMQGVQQQGGVQPPAQPGQPPTPNIDASQAAAMILKNNKFLSQNPLAEKDPKTILALAEMQNAQNEATKIAHKQVESGAKDTQAIINTLVTMRGQDLQALAHNAGLASDAEISQFQHLIGLLKELIPNEAAPAGSV